MFRLVSAKPPQYFHRSAVLLSVNVEKRFMSHLLPFLGLPYSLASFKRFPRQRCLFYSFRLGTGYDCVAQAPPLLTCNISHPNVLNQNPRIAYTLRSQYAGVSTFFSSFVCGRMIQGLDNRSAPPCCHRSWCGTRTKIGQTYCFAESLYAWKCMHIVCDRHQVHLLSSYSCPRSGIREMKQMLSWLPLNPISRQRTSKW